MKINAIRKLFPLFLLCSPGLSSGAQSSDIDIKSQILSVSEKVDHDGDDHPPFAFIYDGEQAGNVLSIIDGKDGSSYLFVFRNEKLAYYKKSASDATWGHESLVSIPLGVEEKYTDNFIDSLAYGFGDHKAAIILHSTSTFSETRTLIVDLSTMTLTKNEVTVESTADLYEEYRSQTAPPSTPGPQIPLAIPIHRISTLKNSKLIYYYSRLLRQDNGRIIRKDYFRYHTNGKWSQEFVAKPFEVPSELAEFYKEDDTVIAYGQDVTKDRIILIKLRRKDDAPATLPLLALLVYRENSSGELSLEIVEKDLKQLLPTSDDDFFGPALEGSYNQNTSELSLSLYAIPQVNDQVFIVYDMENKQRVKTTKIDLTKKYTPYFMTRLTTKDGENVGLQESRTSDDHANFSFGKWSGSGELNFYRITDGPVPEFGTPSAQMAWSKDQSRIYTYDSSGSVCETWLLEGSVRCTDAILPKVSNLKIRRPGDGGSLRLQEDGSVELISFTSGYENEDDNRDKKYRVIYSATVTFND